MPGWRSDLDDTIEALRRLASVSSSRLVRLSDDVPTVYVGDIHGDREAVELVFERFPVPRHAVVFLGDLVDRGPDSAAVLHRVATEAQAHPEAVRILMGNHEAWAVAAFSPADFWQSLPDNQAARLGETLTRLPYAAWHPVGVLAVHGALPDVASLEALARVPLGSPAWRALTWGDWIEEQEDMPSSASGRPTFGSRRFDVVTAALGIHTLIRSHQPSAPLYLFDGRCVTVFTSVAYGDRVRRVALLPARGADGSARELSIVEL